MATLATDSFDRADDTTLGSNWTGDTIAIVSNEASYSGTGNQHIGARYNAVSFPDDQWASIVVGSAVNTTEPSGVGPCVRRATNRIFLRGNTTRTQVFKRISGTSTQIGSDGPSVATGDVLYLEIQGTTVIAKKNGTMICGSPIDGSAESLPTSGSAGIEMMRQTGGGICKIASFEAGDEPEGSGGGGSGKPINYYWNMA